MSTTPNPTSPIDQDIPCAQCTYNLRTRLPTDLCPECAHPVADSLHAFSERSKVFPNAILTSAGLNLIALAFAAQFLLWMSRVPHVLARPLLWSANYILVILAVTLTNIGIAVLVYAQRHSRASTKKMNWTGQSINLVNALSFFISITRATIEHFGSHTAAFRMAILSAFPYQAEIVNEGVAQASLALLALFFIFYFGRLTHAIKSPRLRVFAIITFSCLTLVQCAFLLSISIMYYDRFINHTGILDFLRRYGI